MRTIWTKSVQATENIPPKTAQRVTMAAPATIPAEAQAASVPRRYRCAHFCRCARTTGRLRGWASLMKPMNCSRIWQRRSQDFEESADVASTRS